MLNDFTLPALPYITAFENQMIRFYAVAFLCIIAFLLLICSIIRLAIRSKQKRKQRSDAWASALTAVMLLATLISIIAAVLCCYSYITSDMPPAPVETVPQTVPTTAVPTAVPTVPAGNTEPATEATTAPTEPPRVFAPHCTQNSDPANWGIKWEIIVDDALVESYSRPDPISFGDAEEYYTFEGVSTFRGNNYRNDPTYGTAKIVNEELSYRWLMHNGSLDGWPGCGWTGQPQVVKWDPEVKKTMTNMYDSAKENDKLVEVIYGTLDGYIYFFDLADGSWTRDPIYIGMTMKGSGSIDPRGYPILYVGSGCVLNGSKPRMYIVSLIDGSILWEGGQNDPLAPRYWTGFDSAPLVDAETDTLIWPGENGLLYTIKLNTNYDAATGGLSVAPNHIVAARYTADRISNGEYWVGMEDSICIVDHYMYIADNAGFFFCVDINTMELIWAQDIKDDTNASPVFEWGADGNGYLYIAPSLHWTADGSWGKVSLYKLDAQTGEIIWEKPYECGTIEDLSGGVQSTPVLGRPGTNLEGLVIFSISYTPDISSGILVALNTDTGEVVWENEMYTYAWSSPVAVYTDNGLGYILITTFLGDMYLLDGENGVRLDYYDLQSHVESSPVVYNNYVVIGTRSCEIVGFELS